MLNETFELDLVMRLHKEIQMLAKLKISLKNYENNLCEP